MNSDKKTTTTTTTTKKGPTRRIIKNSNGLSSSTLKEHVRMFLNALSELDNKQVNIMDDGVLKNNVGFFLKTYNWNMHRIVENALKNDTNTDIRMAIATLARAELNIVSPPKKQKQPKKQPQLECGPDDDELNEKCELGDENPIDECDANV